MSSQHNIDMQMKILSAHRQTLASYLLRRAQFGIANASPEIFNGIYDSRREIKRVKAILREWGFPQTTHPDDDDPDAITNNPRTFLADTAGSQVIDDFRRLSSLMSLVDSPPIGDRKRLPILASGDVVYQDKRQLYTSVQEVYNLDALDFAEKVFDFRPTLVIDADDTGKSEKLSAYDSIQGFWNSVWGVRFGEMWKGIANFRVLGSWIAIECEERPNKYVMFARIVDRDRLVGRYLNCNQVDDSTPWAGSIVSDQKIQGYWYAGEWNFYR